MSTLRPALQAFWRSCARMAVLAVLSLAGLALADDTVGSRLWVQPNRMELRGADDVHGILVSAPAGSRSGLTNLFRDVTQEAHFSSTDERILTVTSNGLVHAVGDGTAQVLVRFGGQTHPVAVVVQEAAHRIPPSFRQEMEPLLTRLGCNMAHAMASWPVKMASSCHCGVTHRNSTTAGLRMMSVGAESTPPSLKNLCSSPNRWDGFHMKAKHVLPRAPAITAPWRSGSPPEHRAPSQHRRKPTPTNWRSSPEFPSHPHPRNRTRGPQSGRC